MVLLEPSTEKSIMQAVYNRRNLDVSITLPPVEHPLIIEAAVYSKLDLIPSLDDEMYSLV